MALNPATMISLCTVRLESYSDKGGSVGTGYCYLFEVDIGGGKSVMHIPAIVTNNHVVKDAKLIKAVFTIIKQGAQIKSDAMADEESQQEFHFTNLDFSLIRHPDNLDLCIILIGQMLNGVTAGYGIKNQFINKAWHLEQDLKDNLRTIEPVVMIGYPSGLWDSVHNSPIARRGQTASHALTKWNGNREFLIDAACFPGSSGSPVFLYEDGLYRSGDSFTPGTRAKLLGTLWGGPTVTAEGKIVPKPIPTSMDADIKEIALTKIMMNLGFVIHADALDDFIPLIVKKLSA